MIDLGFFRRSAGWLSAAFLLCLASSFGQTFFISLFGGAVRDEFGLSHGDFGEIYLVGTIASAVTLIWLGKLADRFRVITLGLAIIAGLAIAAVAMARVSEPLLLIPVIFALRLFGQGMLGHIAMTAAARWFDGDRGKALAIAGLGHPAGEALLPVVTVTLILAIGWRETWLVAAAVLALAIAPAFTWLLAGKPASPRTRPGIGDSRPASIKTHWTRPQVLRTPLYYLLLVGLLAPPFIGTGVIFHQAYLVEIKGWTPAMFAVSFAAYPLASVVGAFATGFLIDRFSARALLPFYLLPTTLALVLLAVATAPPAAAVALGLLGVTAGTNSGISGAVWAELYGTRHLGSIRSLAVALMVFASALGPGLMGWLIDGGIRLETQFLAMAIHTLFAAGLFTALQSPMRSAAEA